MILICRFEGQLGAAALSLQAEAPTCNIASRNACSISDRNRIAPTITTLLHAPPTTFMISMPNYRSHVSSLAPESAAEIINYI